jgi:hypothetical protein
VKPTMSKYSYCKGGLRRGEGRPEAWRETFACLLLSEASIQTPLLRAEGVLKLTEIPPPQHSQY